MNFIFQFALSKLKLKLEPHPCPFKVAWVDKTSLPIKNCCLVHLKIGSYSKDICCDVLPMDVIDILLRRPWLYDHSVQHCGRNNNYKFLHGTKTILLHLAKPTPHVKQASLVLFRDSNKQRLHIMTPKPFEHECISNGVGFALIAKE